MLCSELPFRACPHTPVHAQQKSVSGGVLRALRGEWQLQWLSCSGAAWLLMPRGDWHGPCVCVCVLSEGTLREPSVFVCVSMCARTASAGVRASHTHTHTHTHTHRTLHSIYWATRLATAHEAHASARLVKCRTNLVGKCTALWRSAAASNGLSRWNKGVLFHRRVMRSRALLCMDILGAAVSVRMRCEKGNNGYHFWVRERG